jgi:transcriptional regulator with PAS, ATPase and Fis domain
VLALAEHVLARERELHGGGAERFSEEVEDLLLSYTWPGNVRELQNTIRASHALAGDGPSIGPDHLPPRVREVRARKPKRGTLNEELNRFRRDLIERTLVESAGNQSRAAKQLGVSRQVLAYQIKELGILVKRN